VVPVLTFLAVVVAWVFFRACSFEAARRPLIGICGISEFAAPGYFDARQHCPLPMA